LQHVIYRDSGQVTVLYSKHMILYTWDEPLGVRKLFWKPYTGVDKPVEVLAAKVYILCMLHHIYNNLWLISCRFLYVLTRARVEVVFIPLKSTYNLKFL